MNVRMTVTVGAYERYVIAKYYAGTVTDATASRLEGKKAGPRTRATRSQVRRFVAAAVRSAVKEQAQWLTARRQRTTASRLAAARLPLGEVADVIPEPPEKQLPLL